VHSAVRYVTGLSQGPCLAAQHTGCLIRTAHYGFFMSVAAYVSWIFCSTSLFIGVLLKSCCVQNLFTTYPRYATVCNIVCRVSIPDVLAIHDCVFCFSCVGKCRDFSLWLQGKLVFIEWKLWAQVTICPCLNFTEGTVLTRFTTRVIIIWEFLCYLYLKLLQIIYFQNTDSGTGIQNTGFLPASAKSAVKCRPSGNLSKVAVAHLCI